MKKKYLILLILFFPTLLTFSQQKDSTILFGKVLSQNNSPVKFAHIAIQNSIKGTISDIQGEFSIKIHQNDVILVSCLGYKTKSIRFLEELPKKLFKTINLNKDTILLTETTIRPWPATYRKLKEKISSMDIEAGNIFSTQDKFLNNEMQTAQKLALRNYGEHPIAISGPFSLAYNAFGNKPRQLRQLPKQTAQANKEKIIKSKFNIEIIKQITKMNNQDSIQDFINYCNYDEPYLVYVDEYDLILDLQLKFTQYKNSNK